MLEDVCTSKGTGGAGPSARRATLNNLPAVLAEQGGPSCVQVREHDSSLQEGQEGKSRELQACHHQERLWSPGEWSSVLSPIMIQQR